MKRIPAIFLQAVIALIGAGAFVFMLWEPHLEGRNAHSTLFEIYFKDAFLAYAYIGSIPFFVALYQAFKLLGRAGQNKIFSPDSVKALRLIKRCALTLIAFLAGGEGYLFMFQRGSEDIAGGVAMGLGLMVLAAIMAAAAARFERLVQSAVVDRDR